MYNLLPMIHFALEIQVIIFMEPDKSQNRPTRFRNRRANQQRMQPTDTGTPSVDMQDLAVSHNRHARPHEATSGPPRTHRTRRAKPSPQIPPTSAEISPASESVTNRDQVTRARHNVRARDGPKVLIDAHLTERISSEIRRGYECMVCMAQIRVSQSVWTCKTCWALFHLKCIHEWIKRNSPTSRLPGSKWEWRCPGCQYVYIEPQLPVYKCYCGRADNPISSRQFTAHSCGEPCSRVRPGCNHPCILSCHPGPCPPCTALLPKSSCFSHPHRTEKGVMVRCGDFSAKPYSCGSRCDRLLSCGIHNCQLNCHEGPCDACDQVIGESPCHCGSSTRPLVCSSETTVSGWGCGAPCTKIYECGIHKCTRKCHQGSCGLCPNDPRVRKHLCECAQTEITTGVERTRCTDRIPTCEKVCGKKNNACGHACENLCHHGPCPECKIQVTQTCRCGRTKRSFTCNEITAASSSSPFTCEQVCKTLKSCSKHKCDIVCCSQYGRKDFAADNHLCLQVCNKTLNCGLHNCDEICHLGKCKPCRVVQREPITCGCGAQSIAPPVACGTPQPICHNICKKPLPNCEHTCMSTCHSGPCSPCPVLVPKMCAGGHRALPAVPCYVSNVSCGSKCGKQLNCLRHICLRTCHAGDCLDPSAEKCKQPCQERREFCEHDCGLECHDGPCPSDEPCRARITASCSCGLRTEESTCRSCASNPNPVPPNISCTMECQIAQRQACLRQAFKPDDVDMSEAEQYAGDLVTQAEKYDKFVRIIDSMLLDASENRTRSLHLPTTDVPRRWLTLEYAQIHYRFNTQVIREGDGLHVVVNFVPGQTRTPRPTLTALLDMMPSQALKYTIDFDQDGPRIHLYDVARGYGRLTVEKIHATLRDFLGSYRTKRGEGFDLFVDFVDANKAVAAYRKLRSTTGLEQCRLLNVEIFDNEHDQ